MCCLTWCDRSQYLLPIRNNAKLFFVSRLVGSSRIERCDDVMMCDEVIDNYETRLSVEQSVRVRLNDDKKNRVCPTSMSVMYQCRCHGESMTGVREEKIQARVCLTALSVKYRCRCHVAMINGVRY